MCAGELLKIGVFPANIFMSVALLIGTGLTGKFECRLECILPGTVLTILTHNGVT